MRSWLAIGLLVAALGGAATAADLKVLRRLSAPAPVVALAPPAGVRPRAVEFSRMILHPSDVDWAIAYSSSLLSGGDGTTPSFVAMTWENGPEGETAAFASAFADELKVAGFASPQASSLFDSNEGSTDLKIGVIIDDIRGRFCVDCPNLFNAKGIPAIVLMTAKWEIFSSLERKVVARVTIAGGGEWKSKVNGTIMPPLMAAFRDNVRRLISSEEFRSVVLSSVTAPEGAAPAVAVSGRIALIGPKVRGTLALASKAVATIFAADGSGSGVLVSSEGYMLTNQHVVGGSKFVKVKWSDGSEVLGEVIRVNARRDVALVKVDAGGRAPLALRTGTPQPGEGVFAIGSPLGDQFQSTLTKGIVSANRIYEGQTYIQSDVAITHGNSGGPLVDEAGNVIGLTDLGIAPDGAPVGINLFIPIEEALQVLALIPAG